MKQSLPTGLTPAILDRSRVMTANGVDGVRTLLRGILEGLQGKQQTSYGTPTHQSKAEKVKNRLVLFICPTFHWFPFYRVFSER